MKRIPLRPKFATEIARVIRTRVQAGDWVDHLPGERILASELQVSRSTLREALMLLEQEGILSNPGLGRRRSVLADRADKARLGGLRGHVFLSPFEMTGLPRQMLAEVDVLRTLLASRNRSLVVRGCPAFASKRPASALAKLVEIYPEHGWILYRAPAFVQEWFVRSGLPVLLRGSPHAGVSLPFMDIDWRAVGRHAAIRIRKNTVGRALFLTTGSQLEGLRLAAEGFREGLAEGIDFVTFCDMGTAEGVGRAMEKFVSPAKVPVLVVCTRARQVVSVQSWLAGHAAKVRYTPSLVCLDYDPLLEHLLPPVGHYRLDPEATARRVVRMAMAGKGKSHSPTEVWLFPEYHD